MQSYLVPDPRALRYKHSIPFDSIKQRIKAVKIERQATILEYDPAIVTCIYVPITKVYKSRKGLSEKCLRRRLENQGWTVWRGGILNIIRKSEVYPNVRKKYEILYRLMETYRPSVFTYLQYLCSVHHGMPDFLCYRNKTFKFVECKLQYEGLSNRQKKCIEKLQAKGFVVEVHKLVDERTRIRKAVVNLETSEKQIFEKQARLRLTAQR